MDGFYSLVYRGLADIGMAVIVLNAGVVSGADIQGVTFDGTYEVTPEALIFRLAAMVPPGVALVQGVPAQAKAYTFKIDTSIPKSRIGTAEHTLVQTEAGPVNVIVRKLRDLPA